MRVRDLARALSLATGSIRKHTMDKTQEGYAPKECLNDTRRSFSGKSTFLYVRFIFAISTLSYIIAKLNMLSVYGVAGPAGAKNPSCL